ncbi:hypothetical protein G3M48_007245 [Beauveria asiatica]|uniref:Uncharacterized protein n=1 Tax=Beauveria asiatica TaxID=1069075 RepID=A0AAW0RMI7_9HYPO
MSNVNLSAVYSRFRRKVTVASLAGRCCEFDNGSRSRRGPKPRQAARQTQAQRILRPLVPRVSSYDQEAAQPACVEVEDEPSWATQEMQAAAEPLTLTLDHDSEAENEDDGNDDRSSSPDGSHTSDPDPLQWKSGLESILYEDDSIADVLPGLDVYTVCHLLEIFTVLASAQLRTLLPTVEIQSHLSSGTMPRCLILAACASAVRFSMHKAVTGPFARRFADSIAREARNCIRISNDVTTQVNTIKSICILVDYSASKAHGRQAWADIATGQALIELARLDCEMGAEEGGALNAAERYLAAAQLTHCLGHPRLLPPSRGADGKPKPDAQCTTLKRALPDLVNLLEILVRVYQLQSVPVKEQKPPPWAPHSKYRTLQNELEEHLLHYPDTFRLFASRPRDSKVHHVDELISSLMWHCCVVVLNRPFLPIMVRISEEGDLGQSVKKVYFPGASHLFVKEKVYRCEASADAIFNISRNIVRANAFHSYATLVGFACTQGALVSINRLHSSSKPYEPTSAGNLRMALAVLEALKTFYTPAEDWINILSQAHDSSIRPALTSDDLDLAFRGYFSRFIDIREPTFVPLDPREKDTPRGAIGTPESVQSQERCLEKDSNNSDLPNTTTSDKNSDWLKAYAGHLSGDIEPDSDSDDFDADSHTKAAQSGTTLASATCEKNPMLTRNAEQVLGAMIPGSGTVESSEHMGAAILTAMSSNMCSPATQPRQSQPEQLQLEHVRGLVQMDMDDGISAPFVHMPSFSEVMGLNLDMSMFPELDLVVGGPEMSPDVFNHDTQENIARIALAIDYDANGYRSLLPMAMQEPALLNAAIAVAASHYSRWQHTTDTVSRRYHRAASKALRDRFIAGNNIHRQDILATMLLLVSFEVFSGSSRWKEHYNAIRGWIRSRGDCSDLDPFLKTWVCLLDTQSSLNLGQPAMPELMSWLDVPANSEEQGDCVDALFGCSSKLVKLMWAASRLCTSSGHGQITKEELGARADSLQEQIKATAILPDSNPSLNISCHQLGEPLTAIGMEQEELRRRVVATAEIFRHASHIYVYRVVHSPDVALTEDLQESLNTAQDLLTMVPDALGPGANLGWCLVVLGAEMDQAHERDYVESRLDGLHLLGLDNTKNGQKILEEVWAHRDLVRKGQASPESWQDAMQRIGQSQILV